MPDLSALPRQPVGPPAVPLDSLPPGHSALTVTLDVAAGGLRFDWIFSSPDLRGLGLLVPKPAEIAFFSGLGWSFEGHDGVSEQRLSDHCGTEASSIHALMRRIRKLRPLGRPEPHIGLLTDTDLGTAKAGQWLPLGFPPGSNVWLWLGREVAGLAKLMESEAVPPQVPAYGRELLHLRVSQLLGVAGPVRRKRPTTPRTPPERPRLFRLEVDFDRTAERTLFTWSNEYTFETHAIGTVTCRPGRQFCWTLAIDGSEEKETTPQTQESIYRVVSGWYRRIPTLAAAQQLFFTRTPPGATQPERKPIELENPDQVYPMIEESLLMMGEELGHRQAAPTFPLDRGASYFDPADGFEAYRRRLERKEQKRAEEAAHREANIRRLAEERRREDQRAAAHREAEARAAAPRKAQSAPVPAARPRRAVEVPPVAVSVRMPELSLQDTALPISSLREFTLRENGALWWVSNQSDDLLCLPHCRLEHLDFQIRTALRVLGPLRGRALLSDEVGLGKTIEAGLVLKELLTRGMVKRYLVLTLPSLVDQWAEELESKFGLTPATTNDPGGRADPARFWRENSGLVASLHTLKQPAHLEIARELQWDLLIVDEAHYLRNRESQAWQAVNVLPRQFLLLLTATPVQNSLEELYNLVTLLVPGQLPTPREFRARFLDPKRPRQPREPEELRRLLGQVMIRNTRANSGINLPPRRAETVLFQPSPAEATFWSQWETEFRTALGRLNPAQSSLWGRLLLRAAGSSPAAWRSALRKFPDAGAAQAWRELAPLEESWRRKCELLRPLVRGPGGAVIFTEFLETQAALVEALRTAGVAVFAINGSTPAPERQPITDRFRENGGALILTHSGTEGRNLQFCHRLANFDLPWNPMEIEQRIGRLHRLGQRHPVEIHNFVQAGTLQEHLLQILQEKLNLFELVVGETGLVLGERFSGEEFEEEIYRRWRESDGRVGEALGALGDELATARREYGEVKALDDTLFAHDYET